MNLTDIALPQLAGAKLAAVGIVLALLLGTIGVQTWRVHSLQADVAEANLGKVKAESARDEAVTANANMTRRLDAQAAAPYCHPRLASVEQTIAASIVTKTISEEPLTDDEWESEFGSLASPAGPTTRAN